MHDAAARYFTYEKKRNAPIHDTETQDLMKLLNENNYEKGAWVLHMLRGRLGDEAFFKGLRDYYNAHREKNATTEDLRDALEKASGKNLHEFFARWVYGSGHPVYEFHYVSAEYSGAGELLIITLNQTQTGEAFLDPVTIEIACADATKRRYTISPTSKTATLQVHLDTFATAKAIKLDPDDALLKEVMTKQ